MENYKLKYAQEAIKAIELEIALDDVITMLVPNLASSQDRDFENICKDIKQSLFKNARETIKIVLKELIEDQRGMENGR